MAPSETQAQPAYKFNPVSTGFFVFLHLGALMALMPFAFSWSAVFVMVFLHWLTASLGICLGFHRYLTHRGMRLPQWLAYTLVTFGTLACENGPIKWVAQHRMHHAGSDTDRDPHSAAKSFWWAHLGWMLFIHREFDDKDVIRSYTKDFYDDRYYQFLEKHFISLQVVLGLILFAIGGIPWVVWGIFLRIVLVYHSTWFVNSAAHYFGYKTFELEGDRATNCWWVALLSYGEGWHNNHHAYPKSAKHGLRFWEIDMTWMAISVLRALGLAKDIQYVKIVRKPVEETKDTVLVGQMVRQEAA